MNGFVKKSVGTLTLGERLRKIRGDRRISLGEISRSTRIQVKYLERLEDDDWDNLPADVYVRGFLRSYAEFFGLDEKVFIKLYEKERGIKNNIENKNGKRKQEKDPVRPLSISFISFTPKKAWIAFISAFALFILIFVYNELGSFASTPKLVVLSPENNSEVEGNSVSISGITEKDSRLFINSQPVLVGDSGDFQENINLQPGQNAVVVKSINRFNKETEYTVNVNSKLEEENFEATNQEQAENSDPEELVLELSVEPGPVWLSVRADDELVFSGNMLTGSSQIFRAKDRIVVDSGKGDATLVKFNGKDVGKLSDSPGSIKEAVFSRDTKFN